MPTKWILGSVALLALTLIILFLLGRKTFHRRDHHRRHAGGGLVGPGRCLRLCRVESPARPDQWRDPLKERRSSIG